MPGTAEKSWEWEKEWASLRDQGYLYSLCFSKMPVGLYFLGEPLVNGRGSQGCYCFVYWCHGMLYFHLVLLGLLVICLGSFFWPEYFGQYNDNVQKCSFHRNSSVPPPLARPSSPQLYMVTIKNLSPQQETETSHHTLWILLQRQNLRQELLATRANSHLGLCAGSPCSALLIKNNT